MTRHEYEGCEGARSGSSGAGSPALPAMSTPVPGLVLLDQSLSGVNQLHQLGSPPVPGSAEQLVGGQFFLWLVLALVLQSFKLILPSFKWNRKVILVIDVEVRKMILFCFHLLLLQFLLTSSVVLSQHPRLGFPAGRINVTSASLL